VESGLWSGVWGGMDSRERAVWARKVGVRFGQFVGVA
jgi:hypothetical protein